MTVLLNRAYMGYQAGTTVKLTTNAEQALIAQGLASAAATASITPGPVIVNLNQGTAAIAAGANSVTITSNMVDANCKVWAVVAQATADTTLLRVERIVVANGSFTIYGTANATAATLIDWAIIVAPGMTVAN